MGTADDLQQAAALLDEARRRRDDLVCRRRAEGATLRQIAAEAGLSHAGVQRVLDRG